jgi:hypothetical protein
VRAKIIVARPDRIKDLKYRTILRISDALGTIKVVKGKIVDTTRQQMPKGFSQPVSFGTVNHCVVERQNSPTAAGNERWLRMRHPRNTAHRNCNAWRQFGAVIFGFLGLTVSIAKRNDSFSTRLCRPIVDKR